MNQEALDYAKLVIREADANRFDGSKTELMARELVRLDALINTPHTASFDTAVELEAAHQQDRWGVDGDAGKKPEDWMWLVGILAGKAVEASRQGNVDRAKHHIIASAAATRNWFRHLTGELTKMRPGHG